MNCQEFREIASEWVDLKGSGNAPTEIQAPERPGRAYRAAEVEEYLKGCASCQQLVEELEAIRMAAVESFPAEVDVPERIWDGLRANLEKEGLIRVHAVDGAAAQQSWKDRLAGWFPSLARPALAGSYILVLVLGASLVGLESQMGVRDFLWTDAGGSYSLNEQLRQAENRTVSAMQNRNPAVVASLNKNLAVVDKFIAMCEKAVNEDPNNELAREYLYSAYQQKADLLARVMDQGIAGE